MIKMDKKYYNENTKEICIPEEEPKLWEEGLGCLIFEKLKLYSNNILQIDSINGEEDIGSSLLQRSIRTALEMKARGIDENDVISICSTNHLNSIVPLIAASFLGAVPANVDPSFSEDDMVHLINLVKPKMIFASPGAFKKIDAIKTNLQCNSEIIVFDDENENSFNKFLRKFENEDTFLPTKRSLDELAVIFFSSGTSGLPKGICTTTRTVVYYCNKSFLPNRVLMYTNLYWISSYVYSITSLLNGKTRILCSKFDPANDWNMYAKLEVDFLFLNPYKVSLLIQNHPKIELPKLKTITVGGSIVGKELLLKLMNLLPNTVVFNAYGQTETWAGFNPSISIKLGKFESIGTPFPERTYRIVDLETEEALGFNQPGELRIKSKYITSGYLNSSENVYDSNGFFKTGDVMYYDEDFCFYVVDRVKEMFKYRGWQVIPAKMEDVIRKHPGVLDTVVVGIPDEVDENLALAVVIPKMNYKFIPKEIEEFANNLLDDIHKLRAGVKIVKEFPLTPSGKIVRRKLKDMFLNNQL